MNLSRALKVLFHVVCYEFMAYFYIVNTLLRLLQSVGSKMMFHIDFLKVLSWFCDSNVSIKNADKGIMSVSET